LKQLEKELSIPGSGVFWTESFPKTLSFYWMVQVFINEFEEGPRQNLLAAVLGMAGPVKRRDDKRKRKRNGERICYVGL
jgi:hypothetical protein